jgi:hypothetical protein
MTKHLHCDALEFLLEHHFGQKKGRAVPRPGERLMTKPGECVSQLRSGGARVAIVGSLSALF